LGKRPWGTESNRRDLGSCVCCEIDSVRTKRTEEKWGWDSIWGRRRD
jgi:hypothetical protein